MGLLAFHDPPSRRGSASQGGAGRGGSGGGGAGARRPRALFLMLLACGVLAAAQLYRSRASEGGRDWQAHRRLQSGPVPSGARTISEEPGRLAADAAAASSSAAEGPGAYAAKAGGLRGSLAAAAADGSSSSGGGRGGAAGRRRPVELKYPLWWHAPFRSGTGYGTEAVNFVLSLVRSGLVRQEDVWVSDHGGLQFDHVMKGMLPEDRADLLRAEELPQQPGSKGRGAIVVCHSVPGAYSRPLPHNKAGKPCPPDPNDFPWSYVVSRTMYETDGVTLDFAMRVNTMDEIWVPSEWQREVFAGSGIDARKLRVVPEGVNTTHFDPSKHAPLSDLAERSQLVFGLPWANKTRGGRSVPLKPGSPGLGGAAPGRRPLRDAGAGAGARQPFRFISSFKWEPRKGWDVLLEAYLSEFTAADDVELYILTKPPGKDRVKYVNEIMTWAQHSINLPQPDQPRTRPSTGDAPPARRLLSAASSGDVAGAAGDDVSSADDLKAHVARVVSDIHSWRRRLQGARSGAGGGDVTGGGDVMGGGDDVSRGRGLLLDDDDDDYPQALAAAAAAAAEAAKAKESPSPEPDLSGLDVRKLPTLYVIDTHLADEEFPGFYGFGDAFVLPSRGEGWGRPLVEAMSMGLPLIATNWSGITAFLDDEVGYPVAVEGLVPVAEDWPQGLSWAQPSVSGLRSLMRRVVERPREARAKGVAARARMVERYSPDAIAEVLLKELRRINYKLEQPEPVF